MGRPIEPLRWLPGLEFNVLLQAPEPRIGWYFIRCYRDDGTPTRPGELTVGHYRVQLPDETYIHINRQLARFRRVAEAAHAAEYHAAEARRARSGEGG